MATLTNLNICEYKRKPSSQFSHSITEVYVDDMIAISQTEEEHLDHLQKLFERLKKYKLKLNPNK